MDLLEIKKPTYFGLSMVIIRSHLKIMLLQHYFKMRPDDATG